MFFKQFYLGCLAHASYLVGSDGEAAVVDPQRDVEQYVEEAEARGLRIKYVLETHLHADFVSGHQELAARTGAEIVFGARAGVEFPHRPVSDGDELAVGSARLRILETPGHTPESISIVISDTADPEEPTRVLTGDTLFIGDVGRPDLVAAKGHTPQEMAGMLYDSLHGKLLVLPDAVEVYPAHGAGSMCGRNISSETSSTVGEQRRTNYALQPMEKDAFVAMMTTDLPPAPRYFSMDAQINRSGAAPLAALAPPVALAPDDVRRLASEGVVLLDVRDAASFGTGHIPGSVNIGLGGQFASWSGSLVPAGARIVLIADDSERVREAVVRLARVGLEQVVGYLDRGLAAWDGDGLEVRALPQIPVSELRAQIDENRPGLQILDVRRPAEYTSGHVPGAVNVPLGSLEDAAAKLEPNKPTAVICAGGYRSSAAASLLEQQGFADLYNVVGGTSAWVKAGYETEQYRAHS